MHKTANGGLASIVDRLWTHAGERKRYAGRLLESLDWEGWLVLAGWDTAATFGPPGGQVKLRTPGTITVLDDLGKITLVARLVTTGKEGPEGGLIVYKGASKAVVLDKSSPNIPKTRINRDPKGLLIALQQIRDRLDSLVFHPPKLRSHMIGELARYSGFSRDHMLRLAHWYTAVCQFL